MAYTSFHHIALVSRNLKETVKLYEEGLGLPVWHVWGRGCVDYIMSLVNGGYVEIMEETHDKPLPRGIWQCMTLKSDNVTESYERALRFGATPLEPPAPVGETLALAFPRAIRSAAVLGLEGEEIGFIEDDKAYGGTSQYESKLHHITVGATDTKRTADFWSRAFGYETVVYGKGGFVVALGDNVYLNIINQEGGAQTKRGVFAHIAVKAEAINEVYVKAVQAGAHPNASPMFCDVIEATPFPVQFWAAAVGGVDDEDITLMHDVVI